MIKFLTDLKLIFLDSLFPYRCLVCGRESDVLCKSCLDNLPILENQTCIMCGKNSFSGLTHLSCKTASTPDGLISLLPYKQTSKLIIEGKYNFISRIFEILGKQTADFLLSLGVLPTFKDFYVTPLPLSSMRERWRGFNQSHIIANTLASETRLKYEKLLFRIRHTKTQKDLPREERVKNILGSFELFPGAHVKGKNILLVDDVVTTGSTLKEAVKVLKRNGANQVWCITLTKD